MNEQRSVQLPFPNLPEGTVTFLFTDIEGSTQLLARLRDKYAILLEEHHRILREVFANWDGHEVDTQGDAFFVAFSRATQSVNAAVEAQHKLSEHAWPEGVSVRVRMGIHTGEPWSGEIGYVGMDVHRAARIAHVGHGGQVLLSETTTALVQDELPQDVTLLDLGRHLLKDIHRPERIHQLVIKGLLSEFPSITSLEVLPPDTARPPRKVGDCPYRGLSAFQEADAQFYFGREAFVDALEQAIITRQLVAVIVGSSGSGKSSAIFAGLLPRLRKSGGYQFAIFRPGTQPFYSLAGAVVPLLEPRLSKTDHLAETGKLAEQLARGKEVHLSQVLERIHKDSPSTSHILLVVDQFEELYTLCSDSQLQKSFIDELLATVHSSQSKKEAAPVILLTMRADFMGQALAHRPFADALQEASLLMGPMNRSEMHLAIEKPAELQGAAFEPGLVERILDDVGEKPGNLPLLEFTLTQLWERQVDGWLTHVDYEAMDGVEGALAAYADRVYAGLDQKARELTRHAFVQLVQPGEGTEDTRRIATHDELGDESWQLIQHLADKRLVVTGRDAQGQETVEVVHEALIQKWGHFQEWMDADRAFRIWQEGLRSSLRQWQQSGHETGALLSGGRLSVAREWLVERGANLGQAEAEYLLASQDHQKALQEAEFARQQRELTLTRRARNFLYALVAILLLAVAGTSSLAYLARQSQNEAERQNEARATQQALAEQQAAARGTQQAIAEAEKANAQAEAISRATAEANAFLQADLARARELSLAANNNLEIDPERSILLALQAVSIAKTIGDTIPIEIQDALHRAVLTSRLRMTLLGHTSDVWAVAYSPDGVQLATASLDGTAKIWNTDTGQVRFTLAGHDRPLYNILYSPDGSLLATADDGGLVILWDSKSGELLSRLAGHTGQVSKLSFNPEGSLLASSSMDQTVRVWDTQRGEEKITLPIGETENPYVSFNFDGTRLLSVGKVIQWWDSATWTELLSIEGTAAEISPDGKRLAIGGSDGSLHLVDAFTGDVQLTLSGSLPEVITNIVFSPDGSRLAGYGWQNVVVWDAITGDAYFRILNIIGVRVIFSPDSSQLISSSQDGTAKVWEVESGTELFTLAGSGSIYNLSINPRCDAILDMCGTHLATANRDQTARIWDISPAGSSELLVVPGFNGNFSQDGTHLIISRFLDRKTVRFQTWDVSPGELDAIVYSYTISLPSTIIAGDININGTQAALVTWDSNITFIDLVNGTTISKFPLDPVIDMGFAIKPDFSQFLTVDKNKIKIWDASNGQKLFDLPEFPQAVTSFAYSSDRKYLALAAGEDLPSIYLLDGEKYQEISSWPAHSILISGLRFSHDNKQLVSTSLDMTAKVWQIPEGKELYTLRGHTATVTEGIFSYDGTLLATCGNDGTTKLWNASTGQNLLTFSDNAWLLSFSPDGKYLASADFNNGLVHVYLMDIDQLVDLANARVTRTLTQIECQQYLHTNSCPTSP